MLFDEARRPSGYSHVVGGVAIFALFLLGIAAPCYAQTTPADADAWSEGEGDQTRVYALTFLDVNKARDSIVDLLGSSKVQVIADGAANRLVIHASATMHQTIKELLGQLDVPPVLPEPSSLPTDSQSVVRSYRVTVEQNALVNQFAKRYADNPAVRQIYDARSAQLVVIGPAGVHEEISKQLGQGAEDKRQGTWVREEVVPLPPVAPVENPLPNNQQSKIKNQKFHLQQLTAETLHARLEKVLEKSLPVRRDATGHWITFAVGPAGEPQVAVSIHDQSREVQIAGHAAQAASWQRIIEILDAPNNAQTTTQLVSTGDSSSVQIRQAVSALQRQSTSSEPDEQANHGDTTGQTPGAGQQNQLSSLLGPVQIEFVEGTDIIVLRGNPRDVQRVMEVIEEIERLSRISEPRIEIHDLQYVDSVAIANLVKGLFNDPAMRTSLRTLYGRLVVIPLVKPNSVLLIGFGSTVEKAIEILDQLDKPGKTLTQYEIFHLQHASAQNAATTIISLFADEPAGDVPTLGPKALIVAEARTNSLLVRAGPRDMAEVRQLVKEIDRIGSEAVNEIRIIKLKNSIASDLAPVIESVLQGKTEGNAATNNQNLAPLLRLVTIDQEGRRKLDSGVLAGATVSADSQANALIVSAPADSMPLLEALIAELDQKSDASAELKVFTIANGDAVSLSRMLQSLFGEPDQQGGESDEELFSLRFSVDERTNSIIAAGTNTDLLVVEAILLRLDSSDVRERKNYVHRLKNASAESVAQSLMNLLQAERDVQETAPGVTSPFEQIEREVVVVPDINSNSLIISATKRYYDDVVKIIQKLDEQAPMVMIQVLIAEIQLGDTDEFGIEFGLQDSALFDRSLLENIDRSTDRQTVITPGGGSTTFENQVIDTASLTPGFNFGDPGFGLGNAGSDPSLATAGRVAGQALSTFGVGRINPEAGFGGLVLSASSNSVSMLLRALQESRRVEVLSRPQIMALDNQTGRVFIGQEVPFIASSDIDTVTGRPRNEIERVDVGLDLQVRPSISPDGLVVMTVFAANKRLGPLSEGVPVAISTNGVPINQPIVDTIEAETTISALSGQTVVLSGLLTKRDRALHRRVPLLADIPLLGDFFKFDSVSTERVELLIILTPHVVRNRHEAERIKQIESARMSWCLSDVVDLHGPAGLKSRNDPLGAAEAETIYPEHIPSVEPIPTEPLPTERQPSLEPETAMPLESPRLPILPQFTEPLPLGSHHGAENKLVQFVPEQTESKPKGFSLLRLFKK